MRRLLRSLRRVAVGVTVVLLLAVAAAAVLVWKTVPGGKAPRELPGLAAPVEVVFDLDGVPRLRAGSETDAAAALGYLHARDRMFQMDMIRRAAAGELAEIVGAAGLPNDRLMRTLGVRRSAEADLAALDPQTRAVLDAYAAGVNAWIGSHGRFSGPEYLVFGAPRPWAPIDSLLWGKMMGLYLSSNWRTELARAGLLARLPAATVEALWPGDAGGAGHPEARRGPAPIDGGLGAVATRLAAVLPGFPDPFTLPATASNAWAVDASHSATGAPLLAGDPHLALSMPATWYLARIELPDRVLAGATAPGVPFMVLGHNGHIAWTFTTTGADTQDLFVETPAGDGYATPDGPKPFETRQETILVRGERPQTLTVRVTRHGPVVSDLVGGGALLALSMANLAPGDTAAAGLRALNRAADVEQAGRAAAMITAPVQNLLVADRSRIALFVTGRVPLRKAGDGSRPARGDDGSQDWTGFASGAALPHSIAPASGRLVNANERVAPPDFPVFLGTDWFADWRARRIRTLLGRSDHHTVESFAAMQMDAVSVFARDVLPRLRRVPPADARSRTALSLLAVWDGTMAREKPQPLIFNAWMRRFRRALLDRNGVADNPAVANEEVLEAALTREANGQPSLCGGPCDPLLATSLATALADQAARSGASLADWRWGDVHAAVFAHPLLARLPLLRDLGEWRIAVSGDDTTLLRAGMRAGSFDAVHGAGFRAVYDLADLDASRFVVVPGQSGNFASPLAWNFVRRWREGGTIALDATPATVAFRIHFTPEGAAE
jgi:penicillin amidase